jgi:NAD+ kinase
MTSHVCPIPERVGIVWKKGSSQAEEVAENAAEYLRGKGVDVLSDENRVDQGDLVLVLGGDGTLIHAARLLCGRAVPILGVNLGSLGFMTEVPRTGLYGALEAVLTGKAQLSERMKLRVYLHRAGASPEKPELDSEVLNDAVIAKGTLAHMVELDTSWAGNYVTTYRSDGMIIATPSGSTAYALAANGPIMYPSMRGMIIAPICPHTLTQRPIVVPDDQPINVHLVTDPGEAYLTLDGREGVPIHKGDRVQVKQSANKVLLVRNPHIDYFGILRAKLLWGER